MKKRFFLWLSNTFDIPKWRVGDYVAILPQRKVGKVIRIGKPSYWTYLVQCGEEQDGSWEISQALVDPYVEEILKAQALITEEKPND